MDVSTPPRLDLACPQAKSDSEKMATSFMMLSVGNEEYGHGASTIT